MKKKFNLLVFIACIIIVFAAGFLGSIFTSLGAQSKWYQSVRPAITPPNYIFPIVWNVLFFLIALALYFAWRSANKKERTSVAWAFGINLVLNALWSYLYFGNEKPELAFIDLIGIWITILVMIKVSWKIDKKSAWLLVPYLIWVSFAGILNYLSI